MTYKATSSDKKKYGLDKPSYVVDVSYYTVEGDSTDQNSTTDESKQKKDRSCLSVFGWQKTKAAIIIT